MDNDLYLFTLPSAKITGVSAPTLQLAGALKQKGRRVVLLCLGGKLAREARALGLEIDRLSPGTILKWGRRAGNIVVSRSQDHFWSSLFWWGKRPIYRLWYKRHSPEDYFWDRFLVPFTQAFLTPFSLEVGGRWRWLPGGVDLAVFRPGERIKGGMRVVMVARMKPGRGQDELVKALAGLEAPLEVTFLGGGERMEVIKSQAESLGVADRCRFISEKVADYGGFLRGQHVLVYLSLGSESTARTVLEAMASGLVVLARAQGGVPYYLGDWNRPIDGETLREALFRYAWAPGSRKKKGLLNARRAGLFSLDRRVERFERVVKGA